MSSLAALATLNPYQRANSLPELLAWPDVDFVRCAYVTLLGRQPDPAGEAHYVDLLRRGASKFELLSQIRRSSEGREHDPGIAGLDKALRRYRTANLPLLGGILRAFGHEDGNSAAERRFRALENQLSLAMLEQDRVREKNGLGIERQVELQSATTRQMAAESASAASSVTVAVRELKTELRSQYQALQLGIDVCRSEAADAKDFAALKQDVTALQQDLAARLTSIRAEVESARRDPELASLLAGISAQNGAVQIGVDLIREGVAQAAALPSRLDAFELHLGGLINAQIELQGALRSRLDDSLALARAAEGQSARVLTQAERGATAAETATGVAAGLASQLPGIREVVEALRIEQQVLVERITRVDRATAQQLIVANDQILLKTEIGFVVIPDDDPVLLVVARHMDGVLEPGTVAVIRHLLDEGDVMVDVGAHVGLISLIASRKVGSAGRVIAIEPVTRSADALETMLRVNFIDNVELQRCAAGGVAGISQINVGRILGHSSLLPLEESSENAAVEVKPVDALVPAGTAVKLVKLDVEGFELECLHGMERLLRDNPTVGIIAEFGPSHLRRADIAISDWFGAFEALGFEAWEIDETSGILSPPRAARRMAAVHSINFLFWRGDKRLLSNIVKDGGQ